MKNKIKQTFCDVSNHHNLSLLLFRLRKPENQKRHLLIDQNKYCNNLINQDEDFKTKNNRNEAYLFCDKQQVTANI